MPHDHMHRRHARPVEWAAVAADRGAAGRNIVERAEPITVTRTVLTTLPATFVGPTAALSTIQAGTPVQALPTTAALAAATSTQASDVQVSSAIASMVSSNGLPASIVSPTSAISVPTTIAVAVQTTMLTSAMASSVASSASTASAAASTTQGTGMTTGAVAGLVIGLILGIGAIVLLVFFCFLQRKKKVEQQNTGNEKIPLEEKSLDDNRLPSTQLAPTTSAAPRLSLRPLTEFLPAFGDRRISRGHDPALTSAPAPIAGYVQRPMTDARDADRSNPFGRHAEPIDSHNRNGAALVEDGTTPRSSETAVAPVALKRGTSKRENHPSALNLTKPANPFEPPSPTRTMSSETSESSAAPPQPTAGAAAAIAAAGGPQHSSVHRIQLDFKPSMDDELEIQAGQLIRILHEYDDGWALCIRLDRSQQGVCPRTCLSARPVKPRAPPGGPRVRGPAPQGFPRPQPSAVYPGSAPRSGPAQGRRGPSPRVNPQGRPSTPQGRPSSPPPPGNPNQEADDSKNNETTTDHSPKPSVDRKPVPGQAL